MQFDSIRNLFANAVERSARKSTGQGRYESKNQPRTRALVLESLETRELLSATPLETASVSEVALASQETTPLDALDLTELQTAAAVAQLTAPTITSTTATDAKIVVKWDAVENATGYVVEYKKSTDAAFTIMSKTTATSRTITNLESETTYKLRVYAVGDGTNYSNSAYSAVKAVKTKTAPVPVIQIDAPTWKSSSSTGTSVTVAWDPVANASGYVVEYKSPNDAGYTSMPKSTAASITITNLAPETTYKLRVYAAGNGVNYADSAYSTIKAVKTKAAPVPALQLDAPIWKSSSSTGTSVTVAWNPVANASGYVVEYKSANDAGYTSMPQTNAASITIPGLAPETTYKLRVYAAGNGVNYTDSAYSTIKAVKTKVTPVPALQLDAPIWKSSLSTGDSVTVAWNPVANASGYVVEYKSANDAGYTSMPQTTAASITIPNLAPETTYKLRVYATSDGVNYSDSDYSAVKAVKTKAAPVPVIQLDAPIWKSSSSTGDSVTVAWNPVANASGYVVEYKSANDASYTSMPQTNAASITIPGLTPETTYKLRVYATGDGVNYSDSDYSAVKAVKTKAAPVPVIQLDAPIWKTTSSTGDSVTVAWNPIANASGYVVEYKSPNDTDYTVMPQTTATTVTVPGLAPETTYKLRVYAVGDGVNYSDSGYSTIKEVKTKAEPVPAVQLDAPTWKSSSSTETSVTVAWNPVANASGYVVEYKGPTDTSYTVMPQMTATSVTIPNLAAETTYKLRVYAAGDGVNYSDSDYSTIKAVKTKAAPVIAVTSLADTVDANDNVITLREAISVYANDGDTITFAPALKGGTITLAGSEIEIDKSIKIDASALWDATQNAPGITIDANSQSRIFFISDYNPYVSHSIQSVEIDSLALVGGASDSGGGAIYANGMLTISNTTFQNNTALDGGAIYAVDGASLTLSNSTFQNNSAYEGGAIVAHECTVTISASTFQNNTANYSGGAIYVGNATELTISNTLLTQNEAPFGAAIYLGGGYNASVDAQLFNVTIFGNGASETSGAAVYVETSAVDNFNNEALQLNVYNSIVAGNVNGDVAGVVYSWDDESGEYVEDNDKTINARAYNVLSAFDGWSNGDAVAFVYDPSKPLFTNAAQGDYTLATGSQALDRGDNACVKTATDLADNVRIMGGTVDLGAYEYEASHGATETPSTVVTSLADVVDATDGLITLREAIAFYANAGDTITFAPTLKDGTITLGYTGIVINKSVTIDASSLKDKTSGAPGLTLNGDSQTRIFSIGGGSVALDSLAFTGGSTTLRGGAIYANSGASLTISNSIFQNNAASYGGAIYANSGASLTISNSTFQNNSSSYGGGAIYAYQSTLTISNSTFQNNSAYNGGAIYANREASLTISNSTFQDNTASHGGAIFFRGMTLNISGSIFNDNVAESEGGAIYDDGAYPANVSDSIFEGNNAGRGGAIYAYDTTMNVSGSKFCGNTATGQEGRGGAICGDMYSTVTISNSTLTQNEARFGAAIYLNGQRTAVDAHLFNVTIFDNSASEPSGAAIYVVSGVGDNETQLSVYNSIVAGNVNGDVAGVVYRWDSESGKYVEDNDKTINARAYNVLTSFNDWSNGNAGVIGYDPSKPLFTNAAQGDYTLATGSQAINRGDNAYVLTPNDLAGNPRIMGGTVDLGAYEYEASHGATETPSTVVTSLGNDVNPTDGVVTLREAITAYANDGDTVTFAPALKGGTITLSGSEIPINKSITIDASALRDTANNAPGITIDADSKSRIFHVTDKVNLDSLAFTGGNATSGGAIYSTGTLTISNSTFQNNSATGTYGGVGGAIYAHYSSTLTISNSTFTKNTATADYSGSGSAIYTRGSANLYNVTIYDNTAKGSNTGALYLASSSSTLNVYNSIVYNNSGGDLYRSSGSINAYNVLSSTTSWSNGTTGVIAYDPSKPLFTDAAAGDYTLAPGSQAIDKGNNEHVPTDVTTDLAGNPRIVGDAVDLGAYEYLPEGNGALSVLDEAFADFIEEKFFEEI